MQTRRAFLKTMGKAGVVLGAGVAAPGAVMAAVKAAPKMVPEGNVDLGKKPDVPGRVCGLSGSADDADILMSYNDVPSNAKFVYNISQITHDRPMGPGDLKMTNKIISDLRQIRRTNGPLHLQFESHRREDLDRHENIWNVWAEPLLGGKA